MLKKYRGLAFMLLIYSMLAFAANGSKDSIQVTQSSPTFTIKLPANPSTGFQWYLVHYNQRLVKPISNTYNAPQTNLIGAGGTSVWQFSAEPNAFKVPQASKLRFEYRRPWESKAGQKQEITVFFTPTK